MTKFFKGAFTIILSLSLASCGSPISEKDLAACDGAWDSVSTALSSAPRATYSDSAPDPTFDEKMDHFMALSTARTEIFGSAADVESPELRLALMEFSLGIGEMAIEFLDNPRGRGTPGITKFNKTFKAVTELCEKSGWKNK
jgi:hypothetical protein